MDNESKKLYNRFILVWAGKFKSFIGTGMTKIREIAGANQGVIELQEYDERLVRNLLRKMTVFDNKLIIEFKSCVEIDINI